jgi:hypothetical protein
MASKKPNKEVAPGDGQSAPEKPKRNYTPSDTLSMKLSKRVTAIAQALAKHYGKKQADILEMLSAGTEPQFVDNLRGIQATLESNSTSAIAGLFDTPVAEPASDYPVDLADSQYAGVDATQ